MKILARIFIFLLFSLSLLQADTVITEAQSRLKRTRPSRAPRNPNSRPHFAKTAHRFFYSNARLSLGGL